MNIHDWQVLDGSARTRLLARPQLSRAPELIDGVARIIEQVRADGDLALRALTRRFDQCEIADFLVDDAEIAGALSAIDPELDVALDAAIARIEQFHVACAPTPVRVETAPGVVCERISRPIRSVGLYVPAGSAPLPSTAIMLGVPARLAGCRHVLMCTPPRADGCVDPAVLAAAAKCGVRRVFKLGGAQAIAAMAYGTGSVQRCDKVFGPGNAWVTEAKQQVACDPAGAAIDLPAGPSEVLVIAERGADAELIASDLLAQAEHGPDSQVVLVSPDAELLRAAGAAMSTQLRRLSRAEIVESALRHARLILASDLEQAFAISNEYAPEHLILHLAEPRAWLERVEAAGSVFLGAWTPEALGDYCSGTNHVLPTYGWARACSGVSLESFMTRITVQEATLAGLRAIGPDAVAMATAEGLDAHRRSVTLRLERAA
ncbi:MAG TPA: histidinol dehydrogenase [Xanthomonadaceae bacterium]|nr:histidinol dehydrogenase [Xanthomonadaceae bacterium]